MEKFGGFDKAEITRQAVISEELEDRWILRTLPTGLTTGQRIEQGKLVYQKEGALVVRIRKVVDMASNATAYMMTGKHQEGDDDRRATEATTPITEAFYEALRHHAMIPDTQEVKIRRYRGRWAVDDTLLGRHAGSVVTEYEHADPDNPERNVVPPEDFEVEKRL